MSGTSAITIRSGEARDRKRAKTLAAIYAILMILLLFLIGFREPYPPIAEEGVLIDFGQTDFGSGTVEPRETEVVEVEKVSEPTPVEPVETVTEEAVTQDIEESVAVPEEPKEEKPVETPVEEKPEPVEEVKPEEPKEPEVNQDAMFSGFGNNNSQSEGNTGQQGNQGDPDGDPNSGNYEGSNSGLGNSGIGFDLSGRRMVGVPTIKDESQKEGIVKVKIRVDRNGKVTYAKYTPLGSTTSDSYLVSKAEAAARKAKFNGDDKAPSVQVGTMTFVFKLK